MFKLMHLGECPVGPMAGGRGEAGPAAGRSEAGGASRDTSARVQSDRRRSFMICVRCMAWRCRWLKEVARRSQAGRATLPEEVTRWVFLMDGMMMAKR